MSSLSRRFFNHQKLPNNPDSTIVFIDSQLSNCDTLIQKVILEARVIVIGLKDDGIKEITRILNSTCCQEVNLISHGSPGCIYLGNSELSLNTLIQYELELKSWFKINSSGDDNFSLPKLFLSGCDVAAGDAGEEFMTKLNSITGAMTASVSLINHHIFDQE
ncbi:MAG: DUF4347 domain-containing protein [Pleurocapsa sp.]